MATIIKTKTNKKLTRKYKRPQIVKNILEKEQNTHF
jgi:hypothetical protein